MRAIGMPSWMQQYLIFRTSSSVDALMRLHKKTKSMDGFMDDRAEASTIRQVWSEIRDGVERGMDPTSCYSRCWLIFSTPEAQSRLAFLQAMNVDVIVPLTNLKVRKLKRTPDMLLISL